LNLHDNSSISGNKPDVLCSTCDWTMREKTRPFKSRTESADWNFKIQYEFTARDTPQQNHYAELGFTVLANKGRAVMHQANIPLLLRCKLWREAFKTVTLLDGLIAVEIEAVTATRYVHWCGQNPAFAKHLKTWGEAGIVKLKIAATPRVADRGVQCMMVGYAIDHEGDCYQMWDLTTKGAHESRDVIWLLRHMHCQKAVQNIDMAMVPLEFATPDSKSREGFGNDTESDTEPEQTDDDDGAGQACIDDSVTRTGRPVNRPARCTEEIGASTSDYEIGLTMSEIRYYAAMKEFPEGEFAPGEVACVGAGLGGGFLNTKELHVMKYKKAMKTPDCKKWEVAVKEEHDRMVKCKAWVAVPIESVPKGEKIITSTWAMKKKLNGTFRARLNARGFEQINGQHYQEDNKAAPVVNDTTFHILLILMLMASWHAEVLDVKGAFLHGLFEEGEQIHMGIPEGFEQYHGANYVLLLLRTLYGLKQAAFAFWKELLKAFRLMEYKRSKADPCLYFAWTALGLVLWISWVDGCLAVGKKEAVMKAKAQMMKRFDCDEVGPMKEYVGCKVDINEADRSLTLTQPILLQSLEDEFELPEGANPRTPAVAGLVRGEVKD
jgi:hypothetical protein